MTPITRRQSLVALLGAAALTGAQAETYPARPIRIVVGFPPGGSSDTTVRLIAASLEKQLGQSVVVENRPGASGAIAAKGIAAMPADGYTLYYATSSSHAIAPHFGKVGYDPVKDFTPITGINRGGLVLTANAKVPVASLRDFVAHVRANPGAAYASPGHASSQHLAMVLFAQENKLQLTHAPYRGSAPALTDLIGGQVPFMVDNVLASLPHIRAGKIKAIAVTGAERSHLLPDVPTMSESGMPGFDVQAWGGIVAPAGTPTAVVEVLNRAINTAMQDPKIRQTIMDGGSTPQGGPATTFAAFIAREHGKWKSVVEANDIKPG